MTAKVKDLYSNSNPSDFFDCPIQIEGERKIEIEIEHTKTPNLIDNKES
jgi:hypothetical protein